MRIIVMGCGRLGSELARYLQSDHHNVAVIDRDEDAFHRLGPRFQGKTIRGVGFDRDVLMAAGIENSDAFVAVTRGDNTNIVGALTAKRRFKVPKVIALIHDPHRALIYRRLGVPTVAPMAWGTHKFRELLLYPEYHPELTFGNGELELTRIMVPPRLWGRPVDTVVIPGQLEVVAITRLGTGFIPVPGTHFEQGDVARMVVSKEALAHLENLIREQ